LRQARGFVAKPYRPRDLARAVRDALGKGPVAGEPSEAPPGNRP
jgi:hypothetical protein